MTASNALTADLRRLVLRLEDDLRARVESDAAAKDVWTAEHRQALQLGRTASSWTAWRDDQLTQAAVGWVLATVFVRFCEDNRLIAPVWIAGPEHRRQEALDAQLAFFRQHPEDTDREWLQQAIAHLASLPATAALVDKYSALHLVSPSGAAATEMLAFWRTRGDDGQLIHDLTDPTLSTRFLGDLYQDLSEYAKATFALLQTPMFVEEFILDRTLEPALADRQLEGFRLIDPTCGSGHFLLGAFDRLLDRWHRHAPGLELQARVQEALDAIHGVDLNPFAIAIARFRLTVAALQASGLRSLENAPAFRFHLAVGDSLLHGPGQQTLSGDVDLSGFAYATEDLALLRTMLDGNHYDVVVGNPPYITVKDKQLNAAYRQRYSTCKGKYALTVPFMERFFSLAKQGLEGQPAGWVGQITSNSFMKREFGSKLIEDFLVHKDLRLVADTSGAYIPGHGTPTVILVGRNQRPVGTSVRAVLGTRGEPGRPDDPAQGIVWRAIVGNVDDPCDDGWVTVVDLDRALLSKHPWSLSGGGAVELLALLEERARDRLGARVRRIGFFGIMGSDEAMTADSPMIARFDLESDATKELVQGDEVRDFAVQQTEPCWFPYDAGHTLVPITAYPHWARMLWPRRTELGNRATFSGGTYFDERRPWYEWHQLPRDVGASPYAIAFAAVASHNHFVLVRGGNVFKQSAPLIRLHASATDDEHLELLGILNSSTACFWLKQNSYPKGGDPMGDDGARVSQQPWSDRYDFTGTTLLGYPLPADSPLARSRSLDSLAQDLARLTPSAITTGVVPTADALRKARGSYEVVRSRMIAVQEELDWEVYRLYGLAEDLTYAGYDLPGLVLGERAFEVALAQAVVSGQEETAWFTRHGFAPITELPGHWPDAYRELV